VTLHDVTFVQCDRCDRWRVYHEDLSTLPALWNCEVDVRLGSCASPDPPEDAILLARDASRRHGFLYTDTAAPPNAVHAVGAICWAKQAGFPRWPARVEPSVSNIPPPGANHVLVRYYGWKATNNLAWLPHTSVAPFSEQQPSVVAKNLRASYERAVAEAREAAMLPSTLAQPSESANEGMVSTVHEAPIAPQEADEGMVVPGTTTEGVPEAAVVQGSTGATLEPMPTHAPQVSAEANQVPSAKSSADLDDVFDLNEDDSD